MRRLATVILCASLFWAGSVLTARAGAQGPQAPSATRTPVPSTDAQRALLRTEVQLVDQGKLDEAIALAQEVLAENPDNVDALYELAGAYARKKDHAKSLEIATKGAEYKGEQLATFYILIGSAYDEMGDPQKALAAYRQGIEIKPFALLYFNMGITLNRLNNPGEAREAFKKAAALNPNHVSTQFELGRAFSIGGYPTPALFALSRFLILEPTSPRAASAYSAWRQVLNGGVTPQGNGRGLSVPVNPAPKMDEGDFKQFDLFISMSKATETIAAQKSGKTEVQALAEQVEQLFSMIDKTQGNDASGFVWKYYGPYFSEMRSRSFVEPFVYFVSQRTTMPGVREWPADPANRARAQEFLRWSASYSWPKP